MLLRILGAMGPYKWLLFVGNISIFICIFSHLQMIEGLRNLLNTPDLLEARLWPAILPILGWGLANRISGAFQYWISVFAANRTMLRLRNCFFDKLLNLSKRFYDHHKTGWLVARGTGDMQILGEYILFSLMMLVIFCTSVFGALFRIGSISFALLLPCLVTFPIICAATYLYRRHMTRTQREARENNSQMVANLTENIRGVREVQAFAREEINLEQFNDLNRKTRDSELKAARLNAMFLPGMDLAGVLNMIMVIGFGSWLLQHPDSGFLKKPLTAGDLAAYFLYMNMMLWPIRMIFELYSATLRASAAAERVFGILDAPVDIQDAPDARPVGRLHGHVAFHAVSFRYGSDLPWILNDFNLVIKPGETVALVGETGSGKTTIACLIARFYDVDKGEIRIDGQDVRELKQDDYHAQMGMVLQDGFLFSGSVLDNIRFRHPDLSDEATIAAARRLGTHDSILQLPDGYATQVHEGGRSISEGQRQLISLTRALVADPAILILDESTSALDSFTEGKVQQALEKLQKNRTTLVIAHRLSTVRHADRILLLKNGRIKEEGTHEELVGRDGLYAQMVQTADHQRL